LTRSLTESLAQASRFGLRDPGRPGTAELGRDELTVSTGAFSAAGTSEPHNPQENSNEFLSVLSARGWELYVTEPTDNKETGQWVSIRALNARLRTEDKRMYEEVPLFGFLSVLATRGW